MHPTTVKVAAGTFLVVGGLLWWASAEHGRDHTVWVWFKGGALRSLTLESRFNATRRDQIWSIEWPVVNDTIDPIFVRARVTHCNDSVEFDCPLGTLENGSCETPAIEVPPGGWGSDRLAFSGPVVASCRVPFSKHPIEWLLGRHRWTFEFDVSRKDGPSMALDPELQIDGHDFSLHMLKAALLAALTGGLFAAARRIFARRR